MKLSFLLTDGISGVDGLSTAQSSINHRFPNRSSRYTFRIKNDPILGQLHFKYNFYSNLIERKEQNINNSFILYRNKITSLYLYSGNELHGKDNLGLEKNDTGGRSNGEHHSVNENADPIVTR